MTFSEFSDSLQNTTVPNGMSPILTALWHDAKGDWDKAHEIAQSQEGTQTYDRLHAYLHRKEGDQWNAGYWYRQAGAPVFKGTLDEEWQELSVNELSLTNDE